MNDFAGKVHHRIQVFDFQENGSPPVHIFEKFLQSHDLFLRTAKPQVGELAIGSPAHLAFGAGHPFEVVVVDHHQRSVFGPAHVRFDGVSLFNRPGKGRAGIFGNALVQSAVRNGGFAKKTVSYRHFLILLSCSVFFSGRKPSSAGVLMYCRCRLLQIAFSFYSNKKRVKSQTSSPQRPRSSFRTRFCQKFSLPAPAFVPKEPGAPVRRARLFSSDLFYSVRSAMTGSFFAAACAGTSPLINVRRMLTSIITSPCPNGKAANVAIPVSFPSNRLIGTDSR